MAADGAPADPSPESTSGQTAAEESVQAFKDALDKSVTISRERLQEAVDELVQRGRMTRDDAEDLVGSLLAKGREQAEDIAGRLEDIVTQVRDTGTELADQQRRTAKRATGRARRELEDATDRARQEVGSRAENARKKTVAAVEQPLAAADRVRRRAGAPGMPISAYDQLTVSQIDARLGDLSKDELRRVKSYEQDHKARKGLLRSLDRKLAK